MSPIPGRTENYLLWKVMSGGHIKDSELRRYHPGQVTCLPPIDADRSVPSHPFDLSAAEPEEIPWPTTISSDQTVDQINEDRLTYRLFSGNR
jgi:hypothetical protein